MCTSHVAVVLFIIVILILVLQEGDEELLCGEDEVLAVEVVPDERGQLLNHGELGGVHPAPLKLSYDGSCAGRIAGAEKVEAAAAATGKSRRYNLEPSNPI